MKDRTSILLRAGLSFGIGVAGLIYLKYSPKSVSNRIVVENEGYSIADEDADGDADFIKYTPKDRSSVYGVYASDMVDRLRKNSTSNDHLFLGLVPNPEIMTPELQEEANRVLRGEDASNFEKLLNDLEKSE